jgi:hypothetical protein
MEPMLRWVDVLCADGEVWLVAYAEFCRPHQPLTPTLSNATRPVPRCPSSTLCMDKFAIVEIGHQGVLIRFEVHSLVNSSCCAVALSFWLQRIPMGIELSSLA